MTDQILMNFFIDDTEVNIYVVQFVGRVVQQVQVGTVSQPLYKGTVAQPPPYVGTVSQPIYKGTVITP